MSSQSAEKSRTQAATTDRSWTARNVDIAAKIKEISAFDAWVGMQLELCAEFAMRAKEARHFRPHSAIIPRDAANPHDAAAFPGCSTFVRVSHGTTGGRPRDIPLVTESQRALVARAMAAVAPGMYVGPPGLLGHNRVRVTSSYLGSDRSVSGESKGKNRPLTVIDHRQLWRSYVAPARLRAGVQVEDTVALATGSGGAAISNAMPEDASAPERPACSSIASAGQGIFTALMSIFVPFAARPSVFTNDT